MVTGIAITVRVCINDAKEMAGFGVFRKLSKFVHGCHNYARTFVVNLFINTVHWYRHTTGNIAICT